MRFRVRRRRVSALLKEARFAARARAYGFAPDELRLFMAQACLAWCERVPVRFLPTALRLQLYRWLGRAFTTRYVEAARGT